MGSCSVSSGAQVEQVDEPLGVDQTTLVIEIEAYPEPKALLPVEIRELAEKHGGWTQAARAIGGVSEGFIRQNTRSK